MTLPPLAETDDLEARLGVSFTTSSEEARAEALIADASARVRNYTRQDITVVVDDLAVLESTGEQWLYLPQRPVTAVTAVLAGGAPLVAGLWQLQNDALYRHDGWRGHFYGASQPWNQPDTIRVTYTHGYADVPDDIVRIVCKLALSSWLNPRGLRSFQQGDMAATLALETVGVGDLDDDDKRVLDYYRRPRRSVKLSAEIL